MNTLASKLLASVATMPYQLRFTSLHDRGRALSIPCDANGNVDLDGLTERLRVAYFGARAMVGREYSCPTVQLTES
jgi:hypothetical protein